MNIWYYAHSMNMYNTDQERVEMTDLEKLFPKDCIFNPNRHYIQRHKTPMKACIDVIHDPSVTGVVFSGDQGGITQGVYFEIKTAQKLEKPVFLLEDHFLEEFDGAFVYQKKKKRWKVTTHANNT